MSFKNNYEIVDGYLTYNGLQVVFENKKDAENFIRDEIRDPKKSPAFRTYIYDVNSLLKYYNKPENEKGLNPITTMPNTTVSNLEDSDIYTINKTDIDKIIKETDAIRINITPSQELIDLFSKKGFDYKTHDYNKTEQQLIASYTSKIKPLLDSFYELQIKIKKNILFFSIISTKVKINESNKAFFDTYYNILEPVLKRIKKKQKKA